MWQALSGVVVGISIGLIVVALARVPRNPVAPVLFAFVGAGVLWAVGDLVADTASDRLWKQVGIGILYTGTIAMPACWWAVALRWARESGAELPMQSAAWERVPFAIAGLMWLAMVTNPWHGAFLTPVVGGRNLYQPLWYGMAIPNYALVVASLGVEVAVMLRVRRREVQHQGAFLVAASLLTLVGNWVYVSGAVEVNPTLFILSVSGALLVVGMAREGLFGILPAALQDAAADHPDGLVVVGPDGHVRLANARAHELLSPVGISRDAPFLDTLRDERLRPESADLLAGSEAESWSALARPEGVLFRLDDAGPRWLHLAASPVHGRFSRDRGQRIRMIDLTARRQAELHARQARRLDSTADLARTIAREFQGTFALVRSNAELLLSGAAGRAPSERKLSRIIEASTRGSELARQLQLYTGSVSSTRVVLELSEVVREMCEVVEDDLPTGVSLRFDRSPGLLPVHVDALQLRHGLFCVLTNAAEAMADTEGEIRVTTGVTRLDPAQAMLVWGGEEPAGDFAFVRVRDTGGGMDPETEERAFEPFYSTRDKERGSGLPTVLGIARAHGAPLALSNLPDRGCELTLYLPLERDSGG